MREPVVLSLGTGRVRVLYDALMIGLALLVVALLLVEDTGWARTVDLVIWGVFVADYDELDLDVIARAQEFVDEWLKAPNP